MYRNLSRSLQTLHVCLLPKKGFTLPKTSVLNTLRPTSLSSSSRCLSTNSGFESEGSNQSRKSINYAAYASATGILAAGVAFVTWCVNKQEVAHCKQKRTPGSPVDKLPTYTTEDVRKHNSLKSRIWVRLL